MARKKIGHVELRWTCPNCNGVNPGSVRLCGNCGAPQPENIQFFQAPRQELLEDEAKIDAAEAGADIHCPYCEARNPAGTKVCHQCGGDLTKGVKRESGRVVGEFKTGPITQIKCSNCGADNPDTSTTCAQCGVSLIQPESGDEPPAPAQKRSKLNPMIIGAIVAVVILACGGILYLMYLTGRTQGLTGTVESVEWRRAIPIEALVPVEYSAWEDEIPDGAVLETCQDEIRYTQDEPTANSIEVCGTPYTVDTGGGFAEVVQDCEYQVYDNFCTFTIDEWRQVNVSVASGVDLSPMWPEPIVESSQRLGSGVEESYTIIFSTDVESYEFTTSDLELFQQAQIGSSWTLNVNGFGDIVSIEK
jgi:ribosomal protein L40E